MTYLIRERQIERETVTNMVSGSTGLREQQLFAAAPSPLAEERSGWAGPPGRATRNV